MFKQMSTYFLIWLIAFIALILIILLPTDTVFKTDSIGGFEGATYDYQIQNHVANVKMLGSHLIEQKGLGQTSHGGSLSLHILERVGRSLKILVPAILVSLFIGIFKGILDFRLKRSKGKVFGQHLTWGLLSVPDMVVIIGIQLLILRLNGWPFRISLFGHDQLEHVLLNILFLSIYPTMYIAHITFQALQNEEGMDYIRTAKSKGTSYFSILYKHMLKNGMTQIFAHTNTMILYLLSNLFIVEIFTEYRGAAYSFYKVIGSSTEFYINHLFLGNIIETIGYAFFFTFIILLSNFATAIAKTMTIPKVGGASL